MLASAAAPVGLDPESLLEDLAWRVARTDPSIAGSMEGHAAMDMSIKLPGTIWKRLGSPAGFTSVSHVFVMEWAAIIRDLVGGLLIAGGLLIGLYASEAFPTAGWFTGAVLVLFGAGVVLFAGDRVGRGWLHYRRTFWLLCFGVFFLVFGQLTSLS